ncbi:MAG: hypothetical protein JW904_08865 [Spirochaetales bacterium]|nr:hypothetical protein [Spirochaetales bacterium]
MRYKIITIAVVFACMIASQVFAHDAEIVIEVDDPSDQVEVTVEKTQKETGHDQDAVRLGIVAGSEMSEILFNDHHEFQVEFNEHILPGFYAEVLIGHIGLGTTALARFSKTTSIYPGVDYEWNLSWIGTLDLRYHFFEQSFLDPFVEGGLGCAGSVDLPEYTEDGEYADGGDLEALSIFVQIGGGLAVRLDRFHVGAKVMWRIYNDVPPVTQFQPIDVADFQVALFAGIGI